MHYNYDVTIIVPGIRTKNWPALYRETQKACKKFSFELIFSGPFPLPLPLQKEENIKYIQNYGSPTRSLHLATLIAEGKFFTWVVDDSRVHPDSIDKALELLFNHKPEKDLVCMRYSEGELHWGLEQPESYWTAGFHDDLRLPGVNPSWLSSGFLLLGLSRYRELGGFDLAFEHINMNIHDFAFRAQKGGSMVYLSPMQIMSIDWDSTRSGKNCPVLEAFLEHDRPLFHKLYQDDSRPAVIDLENWRLSSPVWERRFKTPRRTRRSPRELLQKLVRRSKAVVKKIIRWQPNT